MSEALYGVSQLKRKADFDATSGRIGDEEFLELSSQELRFELGLARRARQMH